MTMDIGKLVRPNIRALRPYQSARETVQEGVLLDANENPYPVPYQGVSLNRYPDPRQKALRAAVAERLELGPENVLAGSGSDEVLDWVFKVFCQPGEDQVSVAEPTYGMYRVMADIFGVACHEFRLNRNFDLEWERFLQEVPEAVKVLFLCSPNNPTGNLLSREAILRLCGAWGKIVVVDEAYVEFSGSPSLVRELPDLPNLILLRTFSKAFGRAAVRLGYAVASPEIVENFLKVKAPYNLNAWTMECGRLAVQDFGKMDLVETICRQRERVALELKKIPKVEQVFPSQANFLLFRCKNASETCRRLLERGIVVRDRSRPAGLENCIRVSIGTPSENDLFLGELRNILERDV